MKKIIVLFFVIASAFSSVTLYAADNNSGSMSLWERLRKKIETFTPQKKIGATNAVGGVRGAPSDANDIYWKGEASHEVIDADELSAFKKAMDLATAGETKQAHDAFAEFIKNHPDSSLRKDADQALAALAN
jgi:TolA-binding protein